MNPGPTGRESVLLVAELSPEADVEALDGLPMSWHVDAVVIAVTRAAVAKGLRVLMPRDEHFAPLVADVLAEYAEPRMAEGQGPERTEGPASRSSGLMAFATFAAARSTAKSKLGRALTEEIRPMLDLGTLENAVRPITGQAIRAVLLVGNGSNVDRALRQRALASLPHYHFFRQEQSKKAVRWVDDVIRQEFEAELAAARGEIRHYAAPVKDRIVRQEPQEPVDFWKYPDYPLFAQFLLERML